VSDLVILLGVLLAAFGATASVAVVAASRLELTRWVARRLRGAESAATLLSRPGDLASAANALVALGVTLAGVATPWALGTWGPEVTLGVELLAGLPLLGLTAYFLPRAVGRRWPERIVRAVVPRLRPAAGVFGRIVRGRLATERADIEPLFHDAASAGLAREDELEIITGVMAFAHRTVREAMTPRTAIVAAPEGAPTAELARLLTMSGYTRLPLYRGSLDEIVGMVHGFDVIKAGPGGAVRVRPVAQVPATRRCADTLLDLRREGRHLAVVLDEFGGTAGIVTLEDLLEELVGEIFDEGDEPARTSGTPDRALLVVDASHPLAMAAERFGVVLDAPARVATVGGYLAWAAGRIPQPGERITTGGLEFDVLEGTPTRLIKLVVRPAAATVRAADPSAKRPA
jgi:CBS domain containing-hemolysin-like protein